MCHAEDWSTKLCLPCSIEGSCSNYLESSYRRTQLYTQIFSGFLGGMDFTKSCPKKLQGTNFGLLECTQGHHTFIAPSNHMKLFSDVHHLYVNVSPRYHGFQVKTAPIVKFCAKEVSCVKDVYYTVVPNLSFSLPSRSRGEQRSVTVSPTGLRDSSLAESYLVIKHNTSTILHSNGATGATVSSQPTYMIRLHEI